MKDRTNRANDRLEVWLTEKSHQTGMTSKTALGTSRHWEKCDHAVTASADTPTKIGATLCSVPNRGNQDRGLF
jgi:hypothetical protein